MAPTRMESLHQLALLLLTALVCPASAGVQTHNMGDHVQRVMSSAEMTRITDRMDQDGDVSFTMEEAKQFVMQDRYLASAKETLDILKAMDKDNDTRLSFREFDDDLRQWSLKDDEKDDLKDTFASFDGNNDAILEQDEIVRFLSYIFRFRKRDKNKDNVLSFKEWMASSAIGDKGNKDEKTVTKEGKAIFKNLDLNGDKRLDPHEQFMFDAGVYQGFEALKNLFEIADSNSNGKLNVDEMKKLRENQKLGGSAAYYHLKAWIKNQRLNDDEL